MALFKILRGDEANLPIPYVDGQAYFCTNGNFWVDYKDPTDKVVKRKQLNADAANKLHYVSDGQIVEIEAANIATMSYVDDLIGDIITAIDNL